MTVHSLLLNSSQRCPSWQGVILVPNSCLAHGNGLILSVCVIFQWYGCQCLGFLTCAQMLIHATAYRGCTDILIESALEADSGRKIPCCTRDSNLHQYCAWLFRRTLYHMCYTQSTQSATYRNHIDTCFMLTVCSLKSIYAFFFIVMTHDE